MRAVTKDGCHEENVGLGKRTMDVISTYTAVQEFRGGADNMRIPLQGRESSKTCISCQLWRSPKHCSSKQRHDKDY